jgi:hypothetical protein
MADIIRLEKLIERGGIYLDLDVVSVRPMSHLYTEKCVLGKQCPNTRFEGLCNAVIMAEPNSFFLKRWFNEYRSFRKTRWDHHSVKVPLLLSKMYGQHLRVMDSSAFFPVTWEEPEFMTSRKLDYKLRNTFLVHLWESEWEKTVLKNQGPQLLQANSTFARYINSVLGLPSWDSNVLNKKLNRVRDTRVETVKIKPLNPSRNTTRNTSIFPIKKTTPHVAPKPRSLEKTPKPMDPRPGIPYVQPIKIPKSKKLEIPDFYRPIRPQIPYKSYRPITPPPTVIITPPEIDSQKMLRDMVNRLKLPLTKPSNDHFHNRYIQRMNNLYLGNNSKINRWDKPIGKLHLPKRTRDGLTWLIEQDCNYPQYMTHFSLPNGSVGGGVSLVINDTKIKQLVQEGIVNLETPFNLFKSIGYPHYINVGTPDKGFTQLKILIGIPDPQGNMVIPSFQNGKMHILHKHRIALQNRHYRRNLEQTCMYNQISRVNVDCSGPEVLHILRVNFPTVKFIWASPKRLEWKIDKIVEIFKNLHTFSGKLTLSYLQLRDDEISAKLSTINLPKCIQLIPIRETTLPEVVQYKNISICRANVFPLRPVPDLEVPILLPFSTKEWINLVVTN